MSLINYQYNEVVLIAIIVKHCSPAVVSKKGFGTGINQIILADQNFLHSALLQSSPTKTHLTPLLPYFFTWTFISNVSGMMTMTISKVTLSSGLTSFTNTRRRVTNTEIRPNLKLEGFGVRAIRVTSESTDLVENAEKGDYRLGECFVCTLNNSIDVS